MAGNRKGDKLYIYIFYRKSNNDYLYIKQGINFNSRKNRNNFIKKTGNIL